MYIIGQNYAHTSHITCLFKTKPNSPTHQTFGNRLTFSWLQVQALQVEERTQSSAHSAQLPTPGLTALPVRPCVFLPTSAHVSTTEKKLPLLDSTKKFYIKVISLLDLHIFIILDLYRGSHQVFLRSDILDMRYYLFCIEAVHPLR